MLVTANALHLLVMTQNWFTANWCTMLMQNLIKLGLNEKEAILYLGLLRLGPSPVSVLAQRVQIKRVSLYPILDSLCDRGLITFQETAKGRRYIPHDPECLLYGLEKENAELKSKMRLAEDCVRQAQAVPGELLDAHKIVFYKGGERVRLALWSQFKPNLPIFILTMDLSADSAHKLWDTFLNHLEKVQGVPVFILAQAKEVNDIKKRFPSFNVFPIAQKNIYLGGFCIQDGQVLFLSTHNEVIEMMGIRDENYARAMREVMFSAFLV